MPTLDGMEFGPPAAACICCGGAIHRWGRKNRGGLSFVYDRCDSCGFVFVNPRPTLDSLARYYGSYEPHNFGSTVVNQSRAIISPEARRMVRVMTSIRAAPGKLLDIGAGRGDFTLAARRAGLEVMALELQQDEIASLRAIPGVEVQPQLFEAFDGPPASFDYVLMSQVLEHALDARAFVRKAADLLTPGGVLAIALPNFDSLWRRIAGTRDPYFIPPEHLNHFNRRSLRMVCERCGLRVVRIAEIPSLPNDVLSKRLPWKRVLAPVIEPMTAAARLVFGAVTAIARCGIMLNLYAMKTL